MRAVEELAAERELILRRRELAAEVAEVRAGWDPLVNDACRLATWTCDQRHRGGRSGPKMGEAVRLIDGRVFFASRIKWRPGDLARLPPWERESHLGVALDGLVLERLLDSDRQLSDWLDRLDEWELGREPAGERAVKGLLPQGVATISAPNDTVEPAITPWMRCQQHPGESFSLTRAELFAATR